MTLSLSDHTDLSPEEKRRLLQELLQKKAAQGRTLPLSAAQHRLWFLDQLDPGLPFYNVSRAMHLHGALDVAALEKSLTALLHRHEALRTAFIATDGQPLQQIAATVQLALIVQDVATTDEAETIASEEAQRPFDLTKAPLWRTTLLRLSPTHHVLVLILHHIISDGWTMGILQEELATFYEAYQQGTTPVLPPVTVQYGDYTLRQRQHTQSEQATHDLTYWQAHLADLPTLELPTDFPRPAVNSHRGAHVPFTLSPDTTAALKQVAHANHATLFMTVLAAFQVLLARRGGQTESVVGTPIANRSTPDVERTVGFFVNTLVCRTDLHGNPTFREVLGRVRDMTLSAYAHQELPFDRVVESLQPQRLQSHNPLFQTMFSLNPPTRPLTQMRNVAVAARPIPNHHAKFDLNVELGETGDGGLRGYFEYRPDLFMAESIERMAAQFATLLDAIVARPNQRISDLDILPVAERALLLERWTDTRRSYPHEATIHELFAQQAAATPEAVALISADTTLTYGDLNVRANRWAHRLVATGVTPDSLVALTVDRSIEMVVALLAILKAGVGYLPLDATLPPARYDVLLADSGATVLLTTTTLRASLPDLSHLTVLLLDDEATVEDFPATVPAVMVSSDHLAYTMFTSGSTGTPKGVAVPHRAVVRLVRNNTFASLDRDSVLLQLAPLAFDASTLELWGALLNGGKLVLAPPHAPTLAELAHLIRSNGVTTLWLTAGLFHQIVDEDIDALRPVRTLLAGGDVLSPSHVRRVLEQLPDTTVINGYGPTENTTFTTTFPMATPDAVTATVPIGYAIAQTQVYLLDAHLQPVPIGVPGELYSGGDGLARGYLHRPKLTAERFIPNPFALAQQTGERLYRTGDLARYRHDGTIEFLGRRDFQVKLRGFRIELGEIEAALLAHPSVAEAIVTVHTGDHPADKRLVAYVVPVTGTSLTPVDLRAFLGQRLPDYMVPAAIMGLEQLPLTPNGKVNRAALPAPIWQAQEHHTDDSITPTEELLMGMWSQVLNTPVNDRHANFFDLGGHSLILTQLFARIRTLFAVELPLRTLFEDPTLSGLARRVDAAMGTKGNTIATPLVRIPRDGVLPLSVAQQRLWFLEQYDPNSATYNVPTVLRWRGAMDTGRLERALHALARRHEALRTRIVPQDGDAVQVIDQTLTVPLHVEDVSGLPATEREAEAYRRATAEAQTPFDLAAGPLVRWRLVRLATDDHFLLLSLHHIIADGWSIGILLRELASLYDHDSDGTVLAPVSLQYADFAAWQRHRLEATGVLDAQLAYWREHLSGDLPVLELPTDVPRPRARTNNGAHLRSRLAPALAAEVHAFSRREGVTLYMTLLAAFQTLLSRLSGQTTIIVGSPVAGRQSQETESVVGFFVNTVAMRGDLSTDPTVRAFLHQTRSTALAAYAHQEVPFEKLVEALVPTRDLSHPPLAQVMFALQNVSMSDIAPQGVSVTFADSESGASRVDLTLILTEDKASGGLNVLVEYSTDLFTDATIRRWLGHYETLLKGMVQDPTQRVSRLPLLPADEWARMQAWNTVRRVAYPRDATISALFEGHVTATPHAVALVTDDLHLTYHDLNRRANQLAHYLKAHGVNAGDTVALFLPRSPDTVVALLAILKVGAAYVPLDPHYPTERLALLLADTAPALVITNTAMATDLPRDTTPPLLIDTVRTDLTSQPDANLPTVAYAERLAYIMYTSGSTGTPKGIGVPHRAVVRLVRNNDFIPQDEQTVFLHAAPLAFDASTLEIWSPLLNGGRVVLYPDELPTSATLERMIAEHGVSSVWVTAGLFHQMVEDTPETFRALRHLLSGGDALSLHAVQSVVEQLPHLRLVNGYGPTENTTFTTCFSVQGALSDTNAVPIGTPIANTSVYLVDAQLRPVPIGVVGELVTGGDGLAWGYWHRPDLTAEKFIPDPFGDTPGARLYRTGDMARYRADGTIEFLGRTDFQVKIRGFRIELGDIEHALTRHPAVHTATVVVHRGDTGDKQLVAYLTPTLRQELNTAEVRAFVAEQLPDYSRPAAYIVLDQLPLSANGKVDRRALPDPSAALVATEQATISDVPRTPLEEVLAAVMATVLELPSVGVNDDFFVRGGHSLRAIQLVSQIRRHIGVTLPLRSLFAAPTVAGIAHHVTVLQQGGARATDHPLRPRPTNSTLLPLSFAQERHWFLHQLEPESSGHNVPFAFRLSGSLDTAALEAAFTSLVARHEVLRTVFPAQEGVPEQKILPVYLPNGRPLVPLRRIDLADMPDHERDAMARRLMTEESRSTFDLATGPLMRTTLLRLGDDAELLLLTLHHIVADGWSTGVLLRDLAVLYQAAQHGHPSPLPELAVQYADFTLWQRERFDTETGMPRQLAYWRERLTDVPLLQLPTDHPRPAVQTFRGASVPIVLDAALTQRLNAVSRREGATLFMTLLAGFNALLSRVTGQDDFGVGTFAANRTHADTEGMLGFFVNNLTLRAHVAGDPTGRDMIARAREVALGAFAHSEVPFETVLEAVQPERSLSHTPLFQVMFVLQNYPEWTQTLGDVLLELVRQESSRSDFDLSLWVRETDGQLIGGIEYNRDLFEPESMARFAAQWTVLLDTMITHLDRPVSRLAILPDADLQQLRSGWQSERDHATVPPFLHERLSAQAARTPDHIAVRAGSDQLTYAELDRKSNQLAHYLQTQGVGTEQVVGIYTGRTVWVAVALWAVLKAGGAYLPLDPMYPQERIAYMLADSNARLVLTDEATLPNTGTATLSIMKRWGDIEVYPTTLPATPTLAGEHLAYLIYTSGSTGRPKGVMVTHQSLISYMEAIVPALGLTAQDRILNFASISFDATTEEIYPAWLAGATVFFRPADLVAPTQEFWALLEREHLTALSLPVAFWHEWVDDAVRHNRTIPAHLRLLLLNAEEPATDRYAHWLQQGGGHVRWVNTYGPTEGTVTATLFEPTPDHTWRRFPIGQPIANTTVYILDGYGEPVPIGVTGELYLGGGGITRGYLNRPELTATAYVPHPFSAVPGARLYRTGDLARFRSDGTIEFFGRGDTQVKIRGFRVELGEIEAVLAALPAVQEGVVLVREMGDPPVKRVVAYVATSDADLTPDTLYHDLQARLPHYMVPDRFVLMAQLPKSPNGKIDRRALPTPDVETTTLSDTYTPPQTPEAEILADIWADVLRVARVGATDNFFRLGGHSLMATQIVARVRDSFQVELPLRVLFERPTIEGLAVVIEELLIERIAGLSDEEVALLMGEGA